MRIDLASIDRENFIVSPYTVAGEVVHLVIPQHIGVKWNNENLHFRSSVWNTNGELVSASYPKFFNNGESPDLYPNAESFSDWVTPEKIDGSTLIVSKYKGELIVRTRGTLDATRLDKNGHEIALLKVKYPKFFDLGNEDTVDYSLIAEWVSNANQIVIRYGEPDLFLIGKIYHEDYRMETQAGLDELAKSLGMKRPVMYSFSSLAEMASAVKAFEGKEGVCLYFNGGQNIVKLKGDWYLVRHRMKSELSSVDKVLDLYLERGQPTFQEFYDYVLGLFDFELAEHARPNMEVVCAAKVKVDEILAKTKAFAEPLMSVSRKEAALAIIAEFKGYAKLCFMVLDGRSMSVMDTKKLYEQVMA